MSTKQVWLVALLLLAFTGTAYGQVCDRGKVGVSGSCIPVSDASDDQIRRYLVLLSIARYSGSCACPESRDRAGRRCGKRSAYSKPGGASPLCYPRDVSDKRLSEFKSKVY